MSRDTTRDTTRGNDSASRDIARGNDSVSRGIARGNDSASRGAAPGPSAVPEDERKLEDRIGDNVDLFKSVFADSDSEVSDMSNA